ncbi:hypothetical protein CASFOL_012550 [Castilleja foliolosa]|uniref:Uncharacterized protein n=1 Tax=Castilleja foliolosa TaxID=1961234 RepID=A0ABD3DHF8_9LAMI
MYTPAVLHNDVPNFARRAFINPYVLILVARIHKGDFVPPTTGLFAKRSTAKIETASSTSKPKHTANSNVHVVGPASKHEADEVVTEDEFLCARALLEISGHSNHYAVANALASIPAYFCHVSLLQYLFYFPIGDFLKPNLTINRLALHSFSTNHRLWQLHHLISPNSKSPRDG